MSALGGNIAVSRWKDSEDAGRPLSDEQRSLLRRLPDDGPGIEGLHLKGSTMSSARRLVRQNLAIEKRPHERAGAFFTRTPTGAKEAERGREVTRG